MDDDEGDDEDGVFGDNDEDDEIQYNKVFDDDDDDEDEVEDQSSVIEHKSGLGSNEVFDNELNLYDQDDYEDDYENYDDDIPGDDEDDDEFISYNKAVDEDVDHNLNPFPFKSQIVDDIPSTPYDHPYQIPFPSQPTTQKPFNSSYHLSISGIDFSEEIETLTNDNNGSGDDILENYLDVMTKSSSSIEKAITTPVAIRKTPELKSVDNLELFDISSPIINGLTIGHNLKHKLMRPGSNHSSKKSSRQTFINRRDSDGIKGEEEDNVSQKQLKIDYGGNEVFKVHSFHQSIGDDLDLKIKQKVNNMEEFHNTIYKSQIKSPEVGLGIETPDSVHDVTISNKTSVSNNSMRKSISSMMDLLSSLESSQTASSRKNSGSNNKDANISTSSFQSDQRKSIVGMMSLLADLEKNQSEVEHSTDKSSDLQKDKMKENRKSINDMMSTLAKLEQSDSNASTSTLKKRRDSISHMMSTLAKLDVSNSSTIRKPKVKDPTIATRRIVSTPINSSKRYSWFNNDEDISINKSGSSTTSNKEDSGHNWDQDMLDEINQLPEDFDFQDHDYKRKLLNKVQDNNNNGFLRSNSYNKKPIRTVMDNKFQTNKIETLNKTVTFYRNSSLGLELGRSGSVSRATSTRSMNSFASVNEEASVEDDYEDHNDESSTFPYERVDSNTVTSNTNLMTITETDSPYLK
ncbi:hypothetical protein DFJ63DRAFT_316196 [Scheffersomyces coipomensis]|uniref:uncharacterized protein n=1 Tax=Scheffersomyces coipomensis TaxID=1788519 RepID=UPI00315CBA92